jgi:integrase
VSKRANLESSIYQDAAGRWHGWVSMGGVRPDGKPDRRHVSAKTRKDLVPKVRELEKKRDTGIAHTAGRQMTFGDWLDHWLTICKRSVRPSTFVGYEGYVRNHIKPALGHHRLDKVQPEHLEAFYADLADLKRLSPAMQLQQHRVISRALEDRHAARARGAQRCHARRSAHAEAPGGRAVRRGRRSQDPRRREQPQERRQVVGGPGHGQPAGRGAGRPWADVDLETGTWRVSQGLQRQAYRHGCGTNPCGNKPLKCPQRTGGLLFVEPKSEKGKRTIGIPSQLVVALRAHRKAQREERMAAGALWQDHGLVFTSPGETRSIPDGTGRSGRRSCGSPAFTTPGCTTPGTPPRPSCSSRASTPASSWRSSGTRRSH